MSRRRATDAEVDALLDEMRAELDRIVDDLPTTGPPVHVVEGGPNVKRLARDSARALLDGTPMPRPEDYHVHPFCQCDACLAERERYHDMGVRF